MKKEVEGNYMQEVSIGEIKVPNLCIGTWAWGQKYLWDYGKEYDKHDLEEVYNYSMDKGVAFFDTAEVYGFGKSEKILGEFIEKYKALHGKRPIIASKYSLEFPWRLRKGFMRKALMKSMKRLGLDSIDLYFIHSATGIRSIETWVNAIGDLYEEGLIKAIGVSNYNLEELKRAYECLDRRGIHLNACQNHYSLLHRKAEDTGILDFCREVNISYLSYMPLAQGILTGKYTVDNMPPGIRGKKYSIEDMKRIQPLLNAMKSIAKNHGDKSLAQVASNWNMAVGTIPVVGAKNLKQAKSNIDTLSWSLTDEEFALLNKESAQVKELAKCWWTDV
ncbi:aldo/keto reductase [Natronospora cellulosivora (SeqCode)]